MQFHRNVHGNHMAENIGLPSHKMFFFSDSNKGRHRIRRKLRHEKDALKVLIEEYNSQVPDQTVSFDTVLETEHPWPWQIAQSGMYLAS